MVVLSHCFLLAPPLSRLFLPVFSPRPTTPLKFPIRAAVKRVSRKDDDDVALASDLQFETPLKIVEYPDPILWAKNKRISVFDENLKNLVDAETLHIITRNGSTDRAISVDRRAMVGIRDTLRGLISFPVSSLFIEVEEKAKTIGEKLGYKV